MRLKDLIQNNSWLSVETVLPVLYPDEKFRIPAYEDVYNKLQVMPEKESDTLIVFDQEYNKDAPNGHYVSVYGRKKEIKKDDQEITPFYALEFTPWEEWLSMDVDINILREFPEPEIIAYCLYEMTFIGFDEAKIRGKLDQLTKAAEAAENLPEEERAKLLTIDKLINGLQADSESTSNER